MEENRKYRIIIVEPSKIVISGLQRFFEFHSEYVVERIFSDLSKMLQIPFAEAPDILILNPVVVDFTHRMSIKQIIGFSSHTALVALTYNFTDQDTLKQYDGHIDIYDEESTILKKLQQLSQRPTDKENSEPQDNYDLTEREKEILIAVAKGMINKEIAAKYNISIHTVISHRKNIIRKTGIKTVSGLTIYALLNNLIEQ